VGYRFWGFFSDGEEAAMAAALARWPFCTAKPIASPFCGFGLRTPDPEREAESDEEYDRLLKQQHDLKDGLPEFSRDHPAATFVFTAADCIGGVCIYFGYVVKAGEVSLRVESGPPGWEPLQRLLRAFGVRLRAGYFEPLVRGYWGRA
jgi:hypothetical protein